MVAPVSRLFCLANEKEMTIVYAGTVPDLKSGMVTTKESPIPHFDEKRAFWSIFTDKGKV